MSAADALNYHHRDTLGKIFGHPSSGNVEWREVLSLLEAVGTVEREHNGKLRVRLGPESEVFRRPHGKDVDRQTLVDLRRMLTEAGLSRRRPHRLPTSALATTATGAGASRRRRGDHDPAAPEPLPIREPARVPWTIRRERRRRACRGRCPSVGGTGC